MLTLTPEQLHEQMAYDQIMAEGDPEEVGIRGDDPDMMAKLMGRKF